MDFSFLKGNNLIRTDDLESPTMMPRISVGYGISPQDSDIHAEEAGPSTADTFDHLQTLQVSPKALAARAPDVPFLQAGDDASAQNTAVLMPPPKPKIRAKIPLEKGYSQIDWLKLTQTKPDLAGLKGRSSRRPISMEEVKLHKTDEDAWTVLRGRVYNISPYLRFHPGGRDMLIKGAGRDCTSLFNKYHAWVNAEFLLEKCLVGVLDVAPQGDTA